MLNDERKPSSPFNASIPCQVFASVRWAVADEGDGGAPITHFTLVYQQVNTQVDVGHTQNGIVQDTLTDIYIH